MVPNDENARPNVEPIFGSSNLKPISNELGKVMGMVASACPTDSVIRFDFDGTLRLHIDLRRYEEMTTVEALLPTICGGIFQQVQRGIAEKHSFFHRLTAIVDR